MHFSSRRSKVSILMSLVAIAAIISAFAVSAALRSTPAKAASVAVSSKGKMTSAKLVGAVSVSSIGKAGQSSAKQLKAPYHARPGSSRASANSIQHISVKSSGLAAGSLKYGFQGVSAVDNSKATGGFDLEPPDEGLAASKGYAVNLVNLTGAIYNANGSIAAGPFPLATLTGGGFFNENLNNIVSDPRAYYDASSHLWIALIWVTLADGSASHVDISINAGNPVTSPWVEYSFDVTDAGAAGCPCLPDFTILGTDAYNIYFVPNEFQLSGAGAFNGSIIYAVAKSDLIGGVKTPNVAKFSDLSLGGTLAYHLQPAATYGSANAEYFANSIDINNSFGNSIGVWALTNRDKIASGVLPTLSSTIVTTETFVNPINAQTPVGFNPFYKQPTSGLLQTDGDALQNLQYINGHLYTTLSTQVNVPGDTVVRTGLAWFDITPKLASGVISTRTSVAAQGYVAKQGLDLLYPHIEHSMHGATAIAFSFTGAQTYPSSGYIVRASGAKAFSDIHVAAPGVSPDNGFTAVGGPGRWGDYSAGQLDASGNGIWFATQYIASNGDQAANWSNYVFEIAG